jgi:hypothetical protein
MSETLISIGLYVAYIAFFAAIAALIFFPLYNMLTGNVGKTKGSLLGVGVLVAVIVIAYLLSPAEQGEFYSKMGVGPGTSKIIGAGLLSTYIVFAGLILITLYTVVSKWFK